MTAAPRIPRPENHDEAPFASGGSFGAQPTLPLNEPPDDAAGAGVDPSTVNDVRGTQPEGPRPQDPIAIASEVYGAMLSACPPDDEVLEDLATLGVAPDLVAAEGFGALRPGSEAQDLVADLAGRFGDEALRATPGLADSPDGSPRLELAARAGERSQPALGSSEAAPEPYVLVPYRDTSGRILAVGVLDPSPGQDRRPRLLGCGKQGRDGRFGGSNHLWVPRRSLTGGPTSAERLRVVTDDLLEALRATSAGVPTAAIRSPTAHSPGAGNTVLPELAGSDLQGLRILYAPTHTKRATEAARKGASSVLHPCGAHVVVLERPPYPKASGVGSFLLSLEEGRREAGFAGLFAPPLARPLPKRDQSSQTPNTPQQPEKPESRTDNAPAQSSHEPGKNPAAEVPSGPRPPDNATKGPPDPDTAAEQLAAFERRRRAPFEAQMELRPPLPERGRRTTPSDRRWASEAALSVGGLVFLVAFCALALLGTLVGTLAVPAEAFSAGDLAPGAEPPTDDPVMIVPWFFAIVFAKGGMTLSQLAGYLGPGPYSVVAALAVAALAAAAVAILVSEVKRRQRHLRIKIQTGRFFQ